MNLAKHDPETDMDMNMTPMIDVVFLLIIFFMIITDMTQQDLEELQLPVAQYAIPDKPDADEWRPVLNIPVGGEMIVKGEALYSPERDRSKSEPFQNLKLWLSDAARKMEDAPFTEGQPVGPDNPLIPDEALLIRADQNTSFKHVQKVMEFCGEEGIRIWKIQLAVAEPPAEDGNQDN